MVATTSRPDEPRRSTTSPDFSFASVFHADSVIVIEGCESKPAVIKQLVEQLATTRRLGRHHTQEIIDRIIHRENLASTAFGRGFAFPHLRTRYVHDFIGAIGILPAGVSFNSSDGDQTKLVFLTLSPFVNRQQHSELLSRVVSLLGNKAATVRLIQIDNPIAFHRTLCSLDSRSPT